MNTWGWHFEWLCTWKMAATFGGLIAMNLALWLAARRARGGSDAA